MKELLAKRAAAVAKLNDARAKFMTAISVDSPTAEQAAEAKKLEADVVALESSLANIDRQISTQKQIDADALLQQKAEAEAEAARIQAERDKRLLDSKGGRISGWDVVGPNGAVEVGNLNAARVRDVATENKWGFASLGSFAAAVREASIRKRETPELAAMLGLESAQMAARGLGESLGSEAGYLVPPTFASKIFSRVYSKQSILGMTDQYTIMGNQISFPRNLESSRTTGNRYGGVQSYWKGEGSAPTASKPKFGKLNLLLNKLIAMAVVTEELRADAGPAIEQYLERAFGDEITFMVGDAIFNGTGSGQPLGILTSAAKVSVAKEQGQAAATINTQNIVKMWSRLWSGCRENAAWFINQDTEPQLHTMTLGIGTAGVATYMPPGGLSGQPHGTILGRPVIPTEFNQTLGTEGDIVLADLGHYVTAMKGGPEMAWSMHLYFDTDEQAFRITFRIDGQPWWASALTPAKGSATQSCVVTLGTRS